MHLTMNLESPAIDDARDWGARRASAGVLASEVGVEDEGLCLLDSPRERSQAITVVYLKVLEETSVAT